MEPNEILQLLGTTNIGAGTYTIHNAGSMSTGYYIHNPLLQTSESSQDVIDQIGKLMDKLSITEDENQLNAVKHLTYAKAFLEKMLLDKINEKTNGDSKSN